MSILGRLRELFRSKPMARRYSEIEGDILNPGRGFFVSYDITRGNNAAYVRDGGHSLVFCAVQLDSYRNSPSLPGVFLASLDRGFASVRMGGLKAIVRFRYGDSNDHPDAPKSIILSHIREVGPILRRHADVIACYQLGWLGLWGEAHGSSNGLDNDDDRSELLHAMLGSFPGFVQTRTGMQKQAYLDRFGANAARIGLFDDAFLASASHLGTFAQPISEWRDRADRDDRVPITGETAVLNSPRTDCANALQELATFQYTALNREYSEDVLSSWNTQGCFEEVARRMGYRFVLRSATFSRIAGAVLVKVSLENVGFAAPFQSRSAYVMVGLELRQLADEDGIPVDVSRWQPGKHQMSIAVSGLPPGTHRVALWLPDPSVALKDPRYSIRCANIGTWNEENGMNVLGEVKV